MRTYAKKPFKQYDGTYLLLQKTCTYNYIHLIGAWSLAFAFNAFMCKVAPIGPKSILITISDVTNLFSGSISTSVENLKKPVKAIFLTNHY